MDKFLIIQTAFLGDAVLTLPMIQELKKAHPGASIDVVSIPSTSAVFENSPFVNEVIILEKRGDHKSVWGMFKFCKEIKKRNYTRIYSPHRSFRSTFIVLQSGVRETYGFSTAGLSHAYKHRIEYLPGDHEVKRNLTLAGINTDDENWKILPCISVPGDAKKKAESFLLENKLNGFITIAPGSIWNTKKYPAEYYSTIIRHFASEGKKILIIGSEEDAELCNSLKNNAIENIISAAGKFSIIEVVEILKYSALLVCNDSAPAHLGMCADIPVLMLYCSTTAGIGFYPYNYRSTWLSYDELSCKPCGIHGRNECPLQTFDCGNLLKPEVVITKMKDLIDDKI